MPHTRSIHYLILAFAVFIGFYWQIGSIPLFDLDEGAFTSATREMFLRHDFITPYLNTVPRFDKPILIYWLQAASAMVFGFNEWAFRLPSALASTAWVFMIYRFGQLVLDREKAFYAALIAATALMTTIIGKAAIADAVLMLFMTASMFAIFRHWQTNRAGYIRWAYVAMALGFLTKGPVAVVIPAVVSLMFYLSTGRGAAWWRAVLDWRGILLFLAVALPWYLLEYAREGQAFIDGFFFKNNVGRFSAPMEGHSAGFWFYPVVTLIALLPYTGLVFRALAGLVADMRGGDWRLRSARELSPEQALKRFGWLWFGFVLLLFSFSGTKLPHYLNYGLVGLMLIMATYFPTIRNRWLHLLPVWGMLLIMLVLPVALDLFFDRIRPAYVQAMLADRNQYFGPSWYLVLGVILGLSAVAAFKKSWALPAVLLPVALSFSLVINGQLLPIVDALQQGPIKAAGLLARDLPGATVMYRMNTPSFGVYAGKILARHAPEPGDLVLTREVYIHDLDAQVLFARGGVVLLRMR